MAVLNICSCADCVPQNVFLGGGCRGSQWTSKTQKTETVRKLGNSFGHYSSIMKCPIKFTAKGLRIYVFILRRIHTKVKRETKNLLK